MCVAYFTVRYPPRWTFAARQCVGEARESRAAMLALSQRAEWAEDAIVARFRDTIAPHIDTASLAIAPLLEPDPDHRLPASLRHGFDALVRA